MCSLVTKLSAHSPNVRILLFSMAVLGFLVPGIYFLVSFVAPGLDLYLAIMAMPFVFMIEQKGSRSLRYGWVSLMFMVLYILLHVQTIYFLGICLFICFMVEISMGLLGRIPIIIAFVISPVVNYFMSVFSFPIRLQLSKLVAFCLSAIQEGVVADGNVIVMGDQAYTVERACIGLKMVVTSAILGLTVLAYHQHKRKQTTTRKHFLVFAAVLAFLVILANFFRILILVKWRIPPESNAHDITGLLSMVFYVLVPLWFLAPRLIKGVPFHSKERKFAAKSRRTVLPLLAAISLAAGYAQYHYRNTRQYFEEVEYPVYQLEGFSTEQPYDDVKKWSTDHSVVYIKPCKSFYHSTHTPTVCWRGSGFELYAEKRAEHAGYPIFMAELRNKETTLYTAWWYENAENRTIDQWVWRADMFNGKPGYAVVNAAATTPELLRQLLDQMLGS